MSRIAQAVIAKMRELGHSSDDILAVVEAINVAESDRSKNAERQARYRDRKAAKASPAAIAAPAAMPAPSRPKRAGPASAEILAAFDRLMAVYPKRKGNNPRKPALEKFTRLVRGGADPETIIRGAKAYALQQKEACKIDTEFVKQTQYWLSAESWEQIAGATKPEAKKQTDEDWRRAVKSYVENRFHWPFDLLSPEPGRVGCVIPQRILEEFRAQMPANIRAEVFNASDDHHRSMMRIWIDGRYHWPWNDTPEPGKPGCEIPQRIINEFKDRLPSHMRWMQTA